MWGGASCAWAALRARCLDGVDWRPGRRWARAAVAPVVGVRPPPPPPPLPAALLALGGTRALALGADSSSSQAARTAPSWQRCQPAREMLIAVAREEA